MQQIHLNQFIDKLPSHPYCADNLDNGLKILTKDIALGKRYIQPNHPYYMYFLVFDLDYSTAYIDYFYSMFGVPKPNLIVENPENGHAHFIYQLATPIYKTDASRGKPIKYANAIYSALRKILNADINYTGLITKNAVHKHWRTHVLREQPYTLDQLSEHLDLKESQINKIIKIDEAIGLGRNCYLFHTVRQWAYVEVRKYRNTSFDIWLKAVIAQCCSLNAQFSTPMQYNETKGVAKSIARWVWKKDPYCYQEFIDRQTRKGKLGASKGGITRSKQYEHLRKKAIALKQQGVSYSEISRTLSIGRRTAINWCK